MRIAAGDLDNRNIGYTAAIPVDGGVDYLKIAGISQRWGARETHLQDTAGNDSYVLNATTVVEVWAPPEHVALRALSDRKLGMNISQEDVKA